MACVQMSPSKPPVDTGWAFSEMAQSRVCDHAAMLGLKVLGLKVCDY